jgi:pyruvate formate lyase activating enzyme
MESFAVSAPATVIEGRVFNLQRCSVHDGPGIRTTVFLKGCPLSCAWCHNPEGISEDPELMLHAGRCLSCGACSEVCPVTEDDASPVGSLWDETACLRCGACVEACPADARDLAGRIHDVGELVDLVERDRPFFEASGGGITFSGGEPLSQPEFLKACLKACRARGLHTAVDTCGLAPRGVMLEVAGLADLILYDLKQMDSEAHRRFTGADNVLILENLRALSNSGTELWVRAPMIPGVNDDDTNLDALGAFLSSLPQRHRVFLLPYHPIAEAKTVRLARAGGFSEFAVPDTGTLVGARRRLQTFGLEVSIGGAS